MTPLDLRRLDCTAPGRGPWQVVPDIANRSINLRHRKSRYIHRVYYGTRTDRTQEDAKGSRSVPWSTPISGYRAVDGKTVVHGRVNETIEGRYRIVQIGEESLQIEHADGRGRQTIRLLGQ